MNLWVQRVLGRVVSLREDETTVALLMFAYSFLAMTAHNAVAGQAHHLPTAQLEAFQAGHGTYINLAWLSAVPGDGLAPPHSGWLTCRSERLTDVLEYLNAANAHLAQLPRDTHLVALAHPA